MPSGFLCTIATYITTFSLHFSAFVVIPHKMVVPPKAILETVNLIIGTRETLHFKNKEMNPPMLIHGCRLNLLWSGS